MIHSEIYWRLLPQWGTRNNVSLDSYSSRSKEICWWKCEKGHEWQASINSRYNHSKNGCPYCCGRRPIIGENDVATLHPELITEWHLTKNGDATLSDYTCGSEHKAWWKCANGHEWQAMINQRTDGTGCPICNGRIPGVDSHNLRSEYPEVAAKWDYGKNSLPPEKYRPHSSKHVYWKCAEGHEWAASIHEMTAKRRNGSCPYCSGHRPVKGVSDLVTLRPDIADEWDYVKNKKSPSDYTVMSNSKVYWVCPKGHSYKAIIANRTKGRGCPICYRKK